MAESSSEDEILIEKFKVIANNLRYQTAFGAYKENVVEKQEKNPGILT